MEERYRKIRPIQYNIDLRKTSVDIAGFRVAGSLAFGVFLGEILSFTTLAAH